MRRALLGFAGLIAAGGTVAGIYVALPGGGEEEVLQDLATETASPSPASSMPGPLPTVAPTPTPASGVVLWRWVNVTVIVPDGSGIRVNRQFASPPLHPPDGGPVLELRRGESDALIDAETGVVIRQHTNDEDRPAIVAVLASIRAGNPLLGEPLPWPYGPIPPNVAKLERGNLRYWEPEPAAGIDASFGCGVGVEGAGCFIALSNGRSRRGIDADSGVIRDSADVIVPEDAEAFDRWTKAIELIQP